MIRIPMYPLLERRTFFVVDCETTGLDASKDDLVEVAAVKFVDGHPTDKFESLANPGVPIPPKASAAHFLTKRDLLGAPDPDEVLEQLATFIETEDEDDDAIIVAHNADFDRGFLTSIADRDWICTWRMARRFWPDAPDHQNSTLRFYLQERDLSLRGLGAHRAFGDALTTGFIFEHAIRRFMLRRPGASMYDLAAFIAEPICSGRIGFGRHKGESLASIPTNYLNWVLNDALEPPERRKGRADADALAEIREELRRRSNA
jgi:DNA polymerase III epsilon subunit-like protein